MNLTNLEIVAPKGMEYYIEDGKIKFRPIENPQYKDVTKFLFKDKKVYYPSCEGNICYFYCADKEQYYIDPRYGTSEKQIKKIFAINKLLNVAKFLNQGWTPDWSSSTEFKYFLHIVSNKVQICCMNTYNVASAYFKTDELAKKAIEILGEDVIKLALSTDY